MKKMFAIVLALMLCVSALSVAAFAAEGEVTVHAVVPEGWDAPNCYSWVDGVGATNWPGIAMTAEEGYAAQTADENLIGSCGVTLTKMRPAGTVRIGDKRYDAASEGDFLDENEEIEVIACHGFQLIVRRKNA